MPSSQSLPRIAAASLAAGAAVALAAVGGAACGKRAAREAPAPETEPAVPGLRGDGGVGSGSGDGSGAGSGDGSGSGAWAELEDLPLTDPERVVLLPAKPDVPRFSVGGPVLAGDLAVVASSQFGFIGVDWRRGTIAWSKPAGGHVAPPVVLESPGGDVQIALVGDCFNPPAPIEGEHLLGCLRVVTPAGVDQAYMSIHGRAQAVEPFALEPGAQALWRDGERTLRWRRGERAVTVDLMTGAASPAVGIDAPPLVVTYKGKRFEIEHTDGKIAARAKRRGPIAWTTENRYTALLGAVWQEGAAPMLRIATLADRGGAPRVRVIDMDATGSLRSANARSMPGIGLLGWGTSPVGDTAIAVRLDRSLRRDFIAGYGVSARVLWVYPLPEQARPDPVGVAVAASTAAAPGGVVVFHDGDTLTILPELSVPPTEPGAAAAPSRNPTP